MDYFVTIIDVLLLAACSFANVSSEPPNLCQTGQYQSPVALTLDEGKTIMLRYMAPLQTYLYDLVYTVPLVNTGSTVRITFDGLSLSPSISRGILGNSSYLLSQIHFHWGSEHIVGGNRFPLEAHFVHYLKDAGNFTEALKQPNGVVVLAVFYKLSKHEPNRGFRELVNNMKYISNRPNKPVFIKFFPGSLLPVTPFTLTDYYYYNGSLTTPDCNEGIQWIIFNQLNYIPALHYRILTKIISPENNLVKSNYRELQPLNDRKIYYTGEILRRFHFG